MEHEAMLKEAKAEASEWARGVLADPAAVILDTETTGLDGEIVEISIITPDGKILLNTLIKPKEAIPPDATAIHGIDNETVKNAPTFREVYLEIKRITEAASRVVIYNASFDEGRLRADCWANDLDTLKFRSECAMLWYAAWYGDWHSYYQNFRWQPLAGGNHRALGDCLACLDRIRGMAASVQAGG